MEKKYYELDAKHRGKVGKGSSRELRRKNLIPAVIYGDKKPPTSISLSTREIVKRLNNGGFMTTILTVNIEGNKVLVLPKSYQLNPVTDSIIHVDFLRISENSKVSVQVPIHFINEDKSPGIKQSGILNIVCHEIELRCPTNNIPNFITVDLSSLKISDNIHISDIELPNDVSPVSQDNFTIATIVAPTSEELEEPTVGV
ncbi:50S ribosomal protein L25/general stress protein Ctc [Liberibacter crescens]|nr:50S ribosomal protein L25/general stress protein Ctc [Liberibacter crescens]AMC12428.1 50S ribosomal protein L25 [Liberibacter crescens]